MSLLVVLLLLAQWNEFLLTDPVQSPPPPCSQALPPLVGCLWLGYECLMLYSALLS